MGELSHVRCPFPACGSSDAFSYNTDTKVGYCHSCGGRYPSKKKTFPWAKEEYPVKDRFQGFTEATQGDTEPGEYVPTRGITRATMEFYKTTYHRNVSWMARAQGNTYSGVSDEYRFHYPTGQYKARRVDVGKDAPGHFATSGGDIPVFFGQDLFNSGASKMVTITEGEWDAMSAYQMLQNGDYVNPVVSVPSATPSKKFWESVKPWLDKFDKILLSIDNDEAGDKLCSRIANMFPNKVYRVDHGKFKDANDFLVAGKAKEYKASWWNARKYTPDNVLNTPEQFIKLFHESPEHQFVETGIEALDDVILGLMQGHFTMFKAPTGIGKTELMRYLEYSLIKKGIPIAAWHLEETKLRSLLGLVSYELNDDVTLKSLIEEKGRVEDVEKAIKTLTEDELFYQFYLREGEGADELIEQIRFLATACGVKFVFFEPIQDVISGLTDESKESALADLAVRLSKLAADLNVGIVSIGHTNDQGDFKYCKMIGQRASVVINLSRNRDSDDPNDRNTTYLSVEKNRPTGNTGNAGKMRFMRNSFTLKEVF